MSDFIEKKLKSVQAFRIYLLVLLIFTLCSFIAIGFVEETEPMILTAILLTAVLLISGILYLGLFTPFMHSIKMLRSKGMENIAEDITLDRPTLPRSKIYCGQRALFCKKPCTIIPYSEIAWVHLYERQAYGIAVDKAIIVYTKEGKKFSLNANADEFQWLLENYIAKNSPNLIVGYGAEQNARYLQLNPQAAEAGKKVKRIWGIVLMCIGAALLIAMIVNIKTAEIVPLTIMILAVLGAGIALYMVGKKK